MAILTTEKSGNVAVVTLDDPDEKVNKLNESLMDEMLLFLEELRSDNSLRGALLISGKQNNFIAGADLDMLLSLTTPDEFQALSWKGHEILLQIENFPKPIVACIHGSCLGGGTELALACRYRILSDHRETRIGLPEVKLGLIPGMGGTQRLPRLIGIQKSLEYMLTGKNMYSRQAKKTGFADEVINRHKMTDAGIAAVQRYANRKIERSDRRGFVERLTEKSAAGRLLLFSQAHKRTAAETRGNYPAPPEIIESVRYGYKEGVEAGLKNESRAFGRVAQTPESKALIQLFFAMIEAKKSSEAVSFKTSASESSGQRLSESPSSEQQSSDQKPAGSTSAKTELSRQQLSKSFSSAPVRKMGIIGAGLMGSGIAEVSIDSGIHVWLKDRDMDKSAAGKKVIYNHLEKKVSRKILSGFERDTLLSHIHPTEKYGALKNADLVIEAVFEDLELKKSIISDLESVVRDNCLIASNTSSIPIRKIAANSMRPENIVGMHYFSPVQKMPLLEVIRTEFTSDHAVRIAFETGLRQGKTVIIVNDGPGFYTTRILASYMNEALLLLEEGVSVEQLDRAMKNFGFPVGPAALLDEVGIDVGNHVAQTLEEIFRQRGGRISNKAAELVNAGYLGRKNGTGFYRYDGGKKKGPNHEIYTFFGGPERTEPDDSGIQFRLVMMMMIEAVYCLHEGIIQKPVDGDLGAVLGLGFPPFLGGPFRYMDREGPEEVIELLQELEDIHGARFRPPKLLKEKAAQKNRFYP